MDEATLKDLAFKFRSSRDEKKGTGYFFSKKEKVSTHGQSNRKSSLSPFSPSMSERSELRRRQEERNLNGVKNLLGARPSPNTLQTITESGMPAP